MDNKEKIWLSPPHISDSEKKYVDEAFSQNWIAPAGPHIDRFEKERGVLKQGLIREDQTVYKNVVQHITGANRAVIKQFQESMGQ